MTGRRFESIDAVYASLPAFTCAGKCQANCSNLVGTEAERVDAIAAGVDVLNPARPVPSTCPALTPLGLCGIYDARPLLCRIYGLAEGLECPHGCRPGRLLSRGEAQHLFAEMLRLGGPATGQHRG